MSDLLVDTLWQVAMAPLTARQKHEEHSLDIVLQVNGESVSAEQTDTVATAMLRAGYTSFTISAKTGLPISPSCLMGVCFGCTCTIDGRPGTQACLEPVRNGQVVTINDPNQ